MKSYQLAAIFLAGCALGDSILDWYDPKAYKDTLICADDNMQYLECNEYGRRFADKIADMIMGTCKEASCSGTFEYFEFQVTVDAVFPPEAKGEFEMQVHSMMAKMHETTLQAIPGQVAGTVGMGFPGKMILNRVADDTEKGHMEVTIVAIDNEGLCQALKAAGAAGSTLPDVGPFFGLISIADC